ncbi:MAG TPA: type II toxin-antitoxin system VapC family toxin [Candidatus Nanoarchaeia archaeon]|nr:type II toxin-antitoxin system VapC family toxin [Candidatus Nanoarchaeia archaeon]
MKRLLLDTNIYGEMVFDSSYLQLKESLKKKVVVHGFKVIRNELRDVPKKVKFEEKNLRIRLLHIYDEFVSKCYEVTPQMEKLSQDYYHGYQQFGGSKSYFDLKNDFLIIACASIHQIDVVVSEDNKSMLSENALKSFQLINYTQNLRTPEFIGYLKFKRWLI